MTSHPFRKTFTRRTIAGTGFAVAASTTFGPVFAQTPTSSPEATPQGSYAPLTGIERDNFVIGMYGLPDNLEPAIGESNVSQATLLNMYETLVRRDFRNGGDVVPQLATSWTRESDLEVVFHLRENVQFHNGATLTADDVVFSFERIITASDDSIFASVKNTYIQTIEAVEAIDDLTVRITTKHPDPILLRRLSVVPSFIVNRTHVEEIGDEAFAEQPNGTGPYVFSSFNPGVELVLERNENYWGDPSPARVVTFTVIGEVASRITALANGEIQISTSMAPDQVESINASGVSVARSVPLNNAHILAFNPHAPGLGDKRTRQALSLAIDRALIIEAIFLGQATHLRQFQFADFGEMYDESRPLTEFDLDRAQQLLQESDYNGELIGYQLVPGYYLNNDLTAQVVVESWQSIGVNAEVQISDAFKLTPEEALAHTWSSTNVWGDPVSTIWRQFGAGSSAQAAFWDAPAEFNEIGAEAERILDVERRRELYGQLTDIWYDEMFATDLYAIDNIAGVDASTNWEPHPLHSIDLHAYNFSFNE